MHCTYINICSPLVPYAMALHCVLFGTGGWSADMNSTCVRIAGPATSLGTHNTIACPLIVATVKHIRTWRAPVGMGLLAAGYHGVATAPFMQVVWKMMNGIGSLSPAIKVPGNQPLRWLSLFSAAHDARSAAKRERAGHSCLGMLCCCGDRLGCKKGR